MTKDLSEIGLVDSQFNQALARAAVAAFDDYVAIHHRQGGPVPSSSTKEIEGRTSSSTQNRRRRRQRQTTTTLGAVTANQNGATYNDFFFEHQRLRGYHLATESMRTSSEVLRLQQELLPKAASDYLQMCGTQRSRAVAERVGDSFQVELWAAVQRGTGAHHKDHVHQGVLVSGVYYAAVPEGSAPLVLKCPSTKPDSNPQQTPQDQHVGPSCDDFLIEPSEGKLVLFPPWLLHGVPLSSIESSDFPRVSFAFNVNGAYAGDPWDITREDA